MPPSPPPARRQLPLAFPLPTVWQALDPAARNAALQVLARILARTASPTPSQERRDD